MALLIFFESMRNMGRQSLMQRKKLVHFTQKHTEKQTTMLSLFKDFTEIMLIKDD